MPLSDAVLTRSIVLPGSSEAWAPVFDRLTAGKPIVLGVFGASVAQVHRATALRRVKEGTRMT